jgi:hypothetical protein
MAISVGKVAPLSTWYLLLEAYSLEKNIAKEVAANPSRRMGHPREYLEQIAMVSILLVAHRDAINEVNHFLRDEGILVKVLTSWWELHARGRKLQGTSVAREALVKRLGVDERWWGEMKLV